ncbi:hypothetical protein BGZ59_000395 [Podila verticillata]|nr:hypothetical protein BGZ59_000395 [Podila verticillata]
MAVKIRPSRLRELSIGGFMEPTIVIDLLSNNLQLEPFAIRLWYQIDDEALVLTLQGIPSHITRLEMNGGGPLKLDRLVQSLMHLVSLKPLKLNSLNGLEPTDTSLLQLKLSQSWSSTMNGAAMVVCSSLSARVRISSHSFLETVHIDTNDKFKAHVYAKAVESCRRARNLCRFVCIGDTRTLSYPPLGRDLYAKIAEGIWTEKCDTLVNVEEDSTVLEKAVLDKVFERVFNMLHMRMVTLEDFSFVNM